MSTGAFEISLGSDKLWSKLETGRIPSQHEFLQMLSQDRSKIFEFLTSTLSGFKILNYATSIIQNWLLSTGRVVSTEGVRRARAGFLKISKLHASTRAMRARAEKPACCDCTRVAEHWFHTSFIIKILSNEKF